ncbi:transmembrane protein, putative [Medicago truncatula]|uniref:Transmembrane protein, putative n=1 Tax=Medicago truncatula TaxID=3880 RepID=G7JDF7_MEDTR|nr:transmembrane protein, putative [Medicago truncatula]
MDRVKSRFMGLIKVRVMDAGMGTPIRYGKGTKVVVRVGTGTGTSIFYKCRYGDGHCSTLPIGYPLPSLLGIVVGFLFFSSSKHVRTCNFSLQV